MLRSTVSIEYVDEHSKILLPCVELGVHEDRPLSGEEEHLPCPSEPAI
jgi:hypothetical protein